MYLYFGRACCTGGKLREDIRKIFTGGRFKFCTLGFNIFFNYPHLLGATEASRAPTSRSTLLADISEFLALSVNIYEQQNFYSNIRGKFVHTSVKCEKLILEIFGFGIFLLTNFFEREGKGKNGFTGRQ